MHGKPPTLRCRKCRGVPPAARFVGAARSICARCQAVAREARAERLKAKPARALVQRRPKLTGASGHLEWIRSLPCCVGLASCGAFIHAHHVRECTGGGTGLKPPDRWAVPLCPAHHLELHQRGARTWGLKYGIDLRQRAEDLAAQSPHLGGKHAPD
ncbi:Protein of unknown function DUF968 [uncultured Caudovirales phage]|uniref:DUF968 domain-containing protein n=1 Tax=uncultured Caudovirales phage TaxID=2100421 RepID=A0A6J5LUM9_9CAUD|nr:Protein of unknown function DUF968 [uncultured Caudovirales phage]